METLRLLPAHAGGSCGVRKLIVGIPAKCSDADNTVELKPQ